MIPTLAERYRVLAVDLPGFGAAPGTGANRSSTATWRPSPISSPTNGARDVIGNSLGSVTALAFASQRPTSSRTSCCRTCPASPESRARGRGAPSCGSTGSPGCSPHRCPTATYNR
ncbi:alpha/beta fold hydrolase [Rhodococcus hoagii]|nr:alpha/beta fold hydrolase [Prescottella equi]